MNESEMRGTCAFELVLEPNNARVACTYICTLSATSWSSNDLYLAAAHGTEIVLKMSGWSGGARGEQAMGCFYVPSVYVKKKGSQRNSQNRMNRIESNRIMMMKYR